ncbi:MAG: hypothetical protein PHW96_02825 [Candidatus Nanoarchaeia archaeon]|nr:hypothetical protein [Candidatus Nanoarchaeia archaeon]
MIILKNELISDKQTLKTLLSREIAKEFRSELLNLIDSEHALFSLDEGEISLKESYKCLEELSKFLHKITNYKIIEQGEYIKLYRIDSKKLDDCPVDSGVWVITKEKSELLGEESDLQHYNPVKKLNKEEAYTRLKKEILEKEEFIKKIFSKRAKDKSRIMSIIDSEDPTEFSKEDLKKAYNELDEVGSYIFSLQVCSEIDEIYRKNQLIIDEKNRYDIIEIKKNDGLYT